MKDVARRAGVRRDGLPRPQRQGPGPREDAHADPDHDRGARLRAARRRAQPHHAPHEHDRRAAARHLRRVLLGADPRHRRRRPEGTAITCSSRAPTATAARPAAMFRAMRGRVDGLIVLSPDMSRSRACARRSRTRSPSSCSTRRSEDRGASTSSTSTTRTARAPMVRHLHGLGHRRIAFIRGPAAQRRRRRAPARLPRGASRSSGEPAEDLELPGRLPRGRRATGLASGLQVWPGLRRRSSRPTTRWRSAASRRCARGDAPCPGTSPSAGFDDIPIASFTAPPLTSVRVSIAELGAAAAERVLHGVRQANGTNGSTCTLPTTLVVRESTGSAPARGQKDRSKRNSRKEEGRMNRHTRLPRALRIGEGIEVFRFRRGSGRLLAVSLASLPAFAQTTTGTLRGIVADESGAPASRRRHRGHQRRERHDALDRRRGRTGSTT